MTASQQTRTNWKAESKEATRKSFNEAFKNASIKDVEIEEINETPWNGTFEVLAVIRNFYNRSDIREIRAILGTKGKF